MHNTSNNMKPTIFPQAIKTLAAPNGVSNCGDLPVYTDGVHCVSRWKPTFGERIRMIFGAPVYLGVMSGHTQPPVWVTSENPFESPAPKTKLALWWYDVRDFVADTASLFKYGFKQSDKRKHFIIGMVISFVFGFLWHIIGLPMPCAFGFLVGAMAGIVKEWWDSKGHGTVEVMDFVFTAFGAFLAMGLTFIVSLIV